MSTNNYVFQLITNGSATGNPVWWRGGKGRFSVVGTFTGENSVSLEYLGPDATTWITANDNTSSASLITLIANGGVNFELPAGPIRAAISGTLSGVYATANTI